MRKKKLKTKQQQQQQQKESKPDKPTPKYDKVSNKIRKLLSATAQTFIPDLCRALREDWYPTISEDEIHHNKSFREYIREKIFDDWSSEQGIYSKDNIWNNATIKVSLPDFLKNPAKQTESHLEKLARMREEKLKKKFSLSQPQKDKVKQLAEELPDSVIVPEEEEEEPKNKWLTDEVLHELGAAPYGETGRSTSALTGDISEHAYKLFAALTNNKNPPTSSDDLLVDYIRPSREFRHGLMLEVDHRRRVEIHNVLHYVSVALEDMIDIIKEIESEENYRKDKKDKKGGE